ncbi:MAG: hypothetical protein SGARI_006060 [Bacillariaceae sp.]
MAAVSLAIIGKNNQPLYLREFVPEIYNVPDEASLFGLENTALSSSNNNTKCSLKQEFLLHAALDRFEELAGPPPGYGWRNRKGASGMYVGLLMPQDSLRVYGYCTTTKIKLFLVVEDEALTEGQQGNADADIRTLLRNIHQLYVEDTLNPFKDLDEPTISSKRFDAQVMNYVAAFNHSEGGFGI